MRIPAQELEFDPDDRASILHTIGGLLEAGRISGGHNVERFEEEFSAYVGARHAVAVASGTTALELIMLAVGVRNRTVLVPANTNFATYIAAHRAGARVRLLDVAPETLAPRLRDITAAADADTAAVVLVHMGGLISPETAGIAAWCRERGIALVEDAAHAHGSVRDNQHAGTFGIGGAFSFFATKVMTCGEGGMVTTNDDTLAAEIRILRNLGKTEPWVSKHDRLGTNGRMTELSAVVGRHQLTRLDEYVALRRHWAEGYAKLLGAAPGMRLVRSGHPYSGYKAIGYLRPGLDRADFKREVARAGVQLAGEVYEIPLHKQPALLDMHAGEVFPGAEMSCGRQVCLPIYPTLGEDRLERVAAAVADVLAAGAADEC
ncbi:DegT/DnrJ/EryC1/StrS family aminotransferase [Streptomyces sp. DSM 41524]|uniref:DegT/DnrJ/EryC1/StrS family aminotransferase n=1 Tax=Streptomyces asiaticus subsp. ignotus TaxID=3098222 RepID=A0ABU7Q6Y0_9ACTN|nr:DegT/DnrJ/EryC1/StrS family aminotransferase [Streptomyces sp. DSM 41524]